MTDPIKLTHEEAAQLWHAALKSETFEALLQWNDIPYYMPYHPFKGTSPLLPQFLRAMADAIEEPINKEEKPNETE